MNDRFDFQKLLASGMTVITAHSGCEGTPPNSLAHLRAATDSGAEMLEVDVRMDAAGALYLSHDEAQAPEACVKLDECFALVSPVRGLGLNLDVKTKGLIEPIMALARKYSLEKRIVFTGEANDARETARALGAEMWHSMWRGDAFASARAQVQKSGSPLLNADQCMVTPEFVERAKEMSAGVSVWTVDSEESIRRLMDMGVQNITTRKPALALKIRNETQMPKLDEARFQAIVREAGDMMLSRDTGEVNEKEGGNNFVTARDVMIEQYLRDALTKLLPVAEFLGEEGGGVNAPILFVVDPIDGTTNYIRDYHASAVSVALVYKGETILGAVYNPYLKELFFARKSGGAFVNGTPIHVSSRAERGCVVALGTSPYHVAMLGETTARLAYALLTRVGDLRRSGSAALDMCAVASGRADAFVELSLSPWDYAAGALIVKEAGGIATRMDGAPLSMDVPSPVLLAGQAIYEKVRAICAEVLGGAACK